ncbi:type II toxin-antitoxin system HipA family toxin [Bradyrhizobium sp. Pear77]|uniref:type II toxin-antitoxin system HipA family toxin n=1 Tax=Bradyrhizobium TaxID=374 RepID=UPI001E2DA1D9|nr:MULTISPECIES: type II toxin-antitoxin system HipA family toxin [Bradyrhizobium]MCC8958563.1 type II toxin-antitoxin system HipA family toxin [Bradyrhizobium altum]MCC8967075.1 type II toxin-antitoxin system HipA family toxin [Bradyrhizobium oropedii]
MTSSECYIFSRLPDDRPKLVGRYRYVRPPGARAFGEFGYAGSWLRHPNAFPLDPTNLPLSRETFTTVKRGCLFGPLADATPDLWGRELVARLEPGKLFSPVDWLYAAGRDRVGCLAFGPEPELASAAPGPERLHLRSLDTIAHEFAKLEAGLPANPHATRIYTAGVSMGGARPKAVIEANDRLWIAKFERTTDTFNQCGAEHATMRLAAKCGLDVAETRLVDVGSRKAILVKRFDRSEGPDYSPTVHYLSALSLINADETSADGSYFAIASELLRHAIRPDKARKELFGRMVFNVLCGNRDDHLKNHALTYGTEGWDISPAFDVLPQPDMLPEQAIAVGRSGVYPSIGNCLSRCGDFGLNLEEAQAEINRIATIATTWRDVFDQEGIAVPTIERVAPAFAIADSYRS